MCIVSNIGDAWKDDFSKRWPNVYPYGDHFKIIDGVISRTEFEELKKEVQALKKLLMAAKEFDKATNQPDCEMDEKVALIKKVAEAVGVNMDEVFKK